MSFSLKKGRNRKLSILVIIGIVSLLIRLLMEYDFDRSALLYVGIPFLITIVLLCIENPTENIGWKMRYVHMIVRALIIMLGSSVILFEGFVCVVMFMPIYFFIVLLMFSVEALRRHFYHKKQGNNYVQILPVLILLSAFEGVVPQFDFEREYEVVSEKVITASVAQIKHQLIQPIELNKSRNWLLSLFPMPYGIEGETLVAGDVHTINFRYHRWFVTNTHEGSMKLEISEVTDNYIKTHFVEDSSYISNYLKLHGTEIHLEPLDNYKTKVTLHIKYHRFLDPAWYFGPLQEYAIGQSAQLLLDEVMTPKIEPVDIDI